MNWADRTRPIQVGDQVGYSHAFLKSTGQHTGDAPRAKGKVVDLVKVGDRLTLALIDWDTPDMPRRVSTANLARVGTLAYGD